MRSSDGEFVVFLDDDARVEPGWLAAYEQGFSTPGCAVVQGRVVPEFMAARPAWLTDELAAFLGRVDEGETAGPLRGNMNSCNMGVARGAFEAIGGFRTDLGPGGIGMAEDTEFGLRAAEKGFAPVYSAGAVARHLIPPERATRQAMIRRLYRSGLSQPVFRAYRESLPRTMGYFARRSVVRLAVAAFTLSGARRMRELCGLAEHAGRVRQIIRMRRGDEPFVSVIVPVHNAETALPRLVASLRAQNFPRERFEMILVDNRSTDRSREVMRRFAEVRRSRRRRGKGRRPRATRAFARRAARRWRSLTRTAGRIRTG